MITEEPAWVDVEAALHAIVEGRSVKRSRHELVWDGRDCTDAFVAVLRLHGFTPSTVANVELQAGERVPAFVIRDRTAYFGWVFWEKFTARRMRKLFGSVVRDERGDWLLQIPSSRPHPLFVNSDARTEMDLDAPV